MGVQAECTADTAATSRLFVAGICRICAALLFWVASPAWADTVTATLSVGTAPRAFAVNPLTNKIYVANGTSANVTVIDGADHSTVNVAVGTSPRSMVVNTVTNKIYVGNFSSNNVTVINGSDNTTATVAVGTNPKAMALNPLTNKIYVVNQVSNNVTVINGVDNSTATVATGTTPFAIAVNALTNKIYVVNAVGNSVTVINGADNTTATVSVGTQPTAIAVNSVTNKIYVANTSSDNVTVINGSDNTTATVTAGDAPNAVALNPQTNKVYIANQTSGDVTVINGADNSTATVTAGTNPFAIAVHPTTNKIYVANFGSANVTVINGSDNTTSTLAAGTSPNAIGVNPVTHKIYVANQGSANVTAIDGAYNTTQAVVAGTTPQAIAFNPTSNKIYVANSGSNNVTAIHATDNTTATITVGSNPRALAVNPATNRIYVANQSSASISVINGSDNTLTNVTVGTTPSALVVNPATNTVYVANSGSNSVSVINGANNTLVNVATGTNPTAIAVNSATNVIYVANQGSNSVTVINGNTNSTATVAVGTTPTALAVNALTNKIYVANNGSDNVTVINGADNTTATVAVGTQPVAIAVNAISNRIYVANNGSNNVTVINGSNNSTATVAVGTQPQSLTLSAVNNKVYVANGSSNNLTLIFGADNSSVNIATGTTPTAVVQNPLGNKVYVANNGSNNVTVVSELVSQTLALTTSISALSSNKTSNLTPTFNLSAATTFSPNTPTIRTVYYQIDSWQGAWTQVSGSGPYTATTTSLTAGNHILYAFAVDGQDVTAVNVGQQSAPLIGAMAGYAFTVMALDVPDAPSAVTAVAGDTLVNISFGIPASNGSAISSYTVTASPGNRSATGTGSPLLVTGLSNDTVYSFSVVATNGVGESAAGVSNSVMPGVLPPQTQPLLIPVPTGISFSPAEAGNLFANPGNGITHSRNGVVWIHAPPSGVLHLVPQPQSGAIFQASPAVGALLLNMPDQQLLEVTPTAADTLFRINYVKLDSGQALPALQVVQGSARFKGSRIGQVLLSVFSSSNNTVLFRANADHSTCQSGLDTSSKRSVAVEAASVQLSGNSFSATLPSTLYSGEVAQFDAQGNYLTTRIGSFSGKAGAVGDPLPHPTTRYPFQVTRLANSPKLEGELPRLAKSLQSSVLEQFAAIGATTLGSASNQGVYRFSQNGSIGQMMALWPVELDVSRSNGLSLNRNGNLQVVSNHVVTTFVPAVSDVETLAVSLSSLDRAFTLVHQANGSYWGTLLGFSYVARPDYLLSTSTLATGLQAGNKHTLQFHNGQGYVQNLYPTFADPDRLTQVLQSSNSDWTTQVNLDGSITASLGGSSVLLRPDWQLQDAEWNNRGQTYWGSDGAFFLRLSPTAAQGVTVQSQARN